MPQTDITLLKNAPEQLLVKYANLLDECIAQLVTEKYVSELRKEVAKRVVEEMRLFTAQNEELLGGVRAFFGALCMGATERICEELLTGNFGEGMPPGVANDIADLYLLLKGSHRLIVKYDALLYKIANKRIENNAKLSKYKRRMCFRMCAWI